MRMGPKIAIITCLAALVAAPQRPCAQAPDARALVAGSWFISLRPGAQDRLRFFAVDAADASRLYLRRFSTPAFYLDAWSGTELKVLLWPEPKRRPLAIAPGAASFLRESSPFRLEYRRANGAAARAGASPYEGDWEIGEPPMAAAVRACEKRAWTLALYFPGDPLSALPMGYYPLYSVGDGTWRSSGAFPDSLVEIEYEAASGALVLRPLFKDRPLAADLYDPVRAWRVGESKNK
jgi:hypothetical protein